MPSTIEKELYGVTGGGEQVYRFRLSNGLSEVAIINYGGRVISWLCADKAGKLDDIVLGYDSLAEYEQCTICMGSLIGRYANRIGRGRFTLDGVDYALEQNNNGNHLHGGSNGFHQLVWEASVEQQALVLRHYSKDGAGGYPGALDTQVRYTLNDQNELVIAYSATVDKPTIVSLTSHCYFNLRGHAFAAENGVLDHMLQLDAPQFLEKDDNALPTGTLLDVAGGPFDFTSAQPLGKSIAGAAIGDGFDHCYVLGKAQAAAILTDPVSGRCLQMRTTMPGMQLYSTEYVDNCEGKDGVIYGCRGSVCLEAQYFPDSPNHAHFPSTVLLPGQALQETTVYRQWAE